MHGLGDKSLAHRNGAVSDAVRAGASASEPEGGDLMVTLELVSRLVAALNDSGVRWCHWKSNEAIDRSASGDNDLDLLVARRDAGRFARILAGLGFRIARPDPDRQVPGIVDHYARDRASGRTVHVHAHYQLALGDDMTKNIHLPVEAAYLGSSTAARTLDFPLPRPEFEYLLFVLRMVVKHSTWDAQLDRKGRLTASERRELAYLQNRSDTTAVLDLVDAELPFVGRRLFSACALVAAERAGRVRRAVTATRLLYAVRSYSRRAEMIDLPLRMWRRRLRKLRSRVGGPGTGKRLDTGGLLIAVVGGDGSGKSTAVDMLVDQLGRDFAVQRFHLGKPPWSRITRLLRRPLRKVRAYGLFGATRAPAWHDFGGRFPGLAFMVWHALTARDRLLEYRRARRATARGAIAVCDRFPLPGIRFMDGPRAGAVPGLPRRPVAQWLATRERQCYAQMLPPDVLVVLRVSPEVAVTRRHDDDADAVRRRATEVFEFDWATTDAVVVDADRPVAEVHRRISDAVWAAL
jgi:thymidylate kinase